MDSSLILDVPPPLDPAWLIHESLQPPKSENPPDIYTNKKNYLLTCVLQNETLLQSPSHSHLNDLSITDTTLTLTTHPLHYRTYQPSPTPTSTKANPAIIYFHGGGLYVGDLSSEDLSCRLISKQLQCTVYSCDYRLLPDYSPDDAVSDVLALFYHLLEVKEGPFILVGSSSGGQLAAQVSQHWNLHTDQKLRTADNNIKKRLVGVLLRCPVTCNASSSGKYLPEKYKDKHISLRPEFYTTLIAQTCVDEKIRTTAKLPLEETELRGLPKHWVQVCSNDIFYSDAVCYVDALRGEGVEVRTRVEWGWPHTFWLKAGGLVESVKAEAEMVEGLRWLMEGV